ncbi:MAG: DNA mismatch repair endonuclease MutL, partial [Ruminiclostridium sp.]
DEDDVEIAFERHATSKIKRAEDLDSIITMGFRGEALASIAAVSSVELQTKTANNTYGMYVHISGGVFKEVRQTGCPVGTTFIIKDLFFNTPARYKFLKKDSTEAGYISDTISRIALGNPDIAFKLISNKVLQIHTPGNNDLKSAIYSIYGKEIIKELMQVEYEDERYKITGYVGKPEAARSNRNYQSLYINKRYVKSRLVSYAVEQAYSSILMKNKFPFFVLNIELNPYLVDANVHPAKMDVRFADESYLSRAIHMAVSKALSSASLFNPVTVANKDREIFKFKNTEPQIEYIQEQLIQQTNRASGGNNSSYSTNENNTNTAHAAKEFNDNSANEPSTNTGYLENKISSNVEYSANELSTAVEYSDNKFSTNQSQIQDIAKSIHLGTKHQDRNVIEKKSSSEVPSDEIRLFTKALEPLARTDLRNDTPFNMNNSDIHSSNKATIENDSSSTDDHLLLKQVSYSEPENNTNDYVHPNQVLCSESESKPEKADLELADMKYIGQAFSTYIILQNGEELVLVDQHAAHERILYEKLKTKYESQENTTQLLLEPVVIQLQAYELDTIKAKEEIFNKIGFVFDDFGNNSIIIRGIPYLIEGYSPKDIFLELTDKLQGSVKPITTPLADEIIHTIACKAAIKANKKLDNKEVQQLLTELANTGRRYTCPHGRPTVIRLTKYEIEKMFKRII